jgi:transcriptional regulator with XRE-family HTH domain
MTTRDRRLDRAHRNVRRGLIAMGDELRNARISAGLTQQTLGAAVGVSHSTISRIEAGRAGRVSYAQLVAVAAVLGLDLPLRAYPAGDPIRDVAQLELLERLRRRLAPACRWRTEVPLDLQGDLRAWDAVIGIGGKHLAVEAETRLRDVQAVTRRIALKARDGRIDVVLLLVADTRNNRYVLRLARPELAEMFPVRGASALRDLASGRPIAASAIVML